MAKVLKTQSMVVKWYGPEIMRLVAKASGDALAKGAKVIGDAVRRNLRAMKTDKPGGWGHHTQGWGPGYMADNVFDGKFQGKGSFTGGFVSLLSHWWIIEWGAKSAHKGWKNSGSGPNVPRPFLHPAIEAKRAKVFAIVIGDVKGEFARANFEKGIGI